MPRSDPQLVQLLFAVRTGGDLVVKGSTVVGMVQDRLDRTSGVPRVTMALKIHPVTFYPLIGSMSTPPAAGVPEFSLSDPR